MTSVNEKAMSSDANACSGLSKIDDGIPIASLNPEDEKKLVRKIDFHLIPIMFILYFFQYIDKTSLGYTAIMGLKVDAHLKGQEYSWVSSFFYVGFLVASPIASVFLVKFPVGRVVSNTVLLWGTVLMCMAASKSFAGLSVLRILLGGLEAAINPGFTILTAMWYKPSEHALRHGLWYGGAPIAMTFGGLLSYAINHITIGMAPWKWLFVLFGAATFLWGIVMLIFLPDSPQHARFLGPEERRQAFARVQGEQHSAYTRKWNNAQVVEALIDPKSWLLCFLAFFLCLPGGGLGSFGSIILQGFGFSTFETLLLGMSQGAFMFIFLVFTVTWSVKFRNGRCISIAICQIFSLIGCLMIKYIPPHNKIGRLAGLWLIGAYASATPTIMSLISSNVIGYTKKAVVGGMFFVAFCAGYIVGPQTMLSHEAPGYETGFSVMVACFVLNPVLVMVLRQVMDFTNKKRDREAAGTDTLSRENVAETEGALAQIELDETDWQNKRIRYEL
ncbi:uncharacterized protein L3040_003764 [Drepanopeziza brunnea f. sp. 'multigermtubi']|uniref:Pantothenate transporter n=1 Tax=Marssonina brunnea f. sp. multigermtubi (strain MB_m1) TaxID=1072389 RepID=K1WPX0_MARBU|nr:pantothenate transporter [Drepanopeziza brunnea f. sp. 'multigermtubi' MB_m1]EKD15036.1 pantothenate transporter [Drepanopeziza brunnea f. sp. 'multigermtubi' MB_m1]KAJ5046521.1 hypothetical protein L3040_003764 [Drepanopeziza brunnea f. sp. 'multigermtubi']